MSKPAKGDIRVLIGTEHALPSSVNSFLTDHLMAALRGSGKKLKKVAQITTGFPVYAVHCLELETNTSKASKQSESDDTEDSNETTLRLRKIENEKENESVVDGIQKQEYWIVAGGGGNARYGVASGFVLYAVHPTLIHCQTALSTTPAAPMHFAIHEKILACGLDAECGVFQLHQTEQVKEFQSLSKWKTEVKESEDAHQKCSLVKKRDATSLVVATGGTDGILRLWEWKHTEKQSQLLTEIETENNQEIVSLAWESSHFILVTAQKVQIFHVSDDFKWKASQSIPAEKDTNWRLAYLVENQLILIANRRKDQRNKAHWFIYQFSDNEWRQSQVKITQNGPVTCLAVKKDLIIYGTATGCMARLNLKTFSDRGRIQQAHGFAVTTVAFRPTGNGFISGSADGSLAVYEADSGRACVYEWLGYFLVLLIAYLLLLLQNQFPDR